LKATKQKLIIEICDYTCFALRINLYIFSCVVHFLREWEMMCKVLATRASLDRHTGVNLAAEVNNTMKEFGLEHCVFACIHDNAANVNVAGKMINGTKDRPIQYRLCGT
jgi:hypothetical protein